MAPSNDYEGFEGFVWDGLSPRKFFAGRQRVAKLVAQAVALWPERDLASFEVKPFQTFLRKTLDYQIKSEYSDRRFGSIWIILLSALASEIIKLIIQWWLSRDSHRALMKRWRREYGG